MAEAARADEAFAIGNDEQYRPVQGWKGGYPALGPAPLSSFAAMDSLLAHMAPSPGHDPDVVVFGNSAGGQFVNRYAAVGRGPDALAERGLRVRFVISNPSTYLYFNQDRPDSGSAPSGRGLTPVGAMRARGVQVSDAPLA